MTADGVARVETAAVILGGEAELFAVAMETDGDAAGSTVTQAVADGFADDLEQVGELIGCQPMHGLLVDAEIGLDLAAGGEMTDDGADGVGEAALAELFGPEAGDVGADFADGGVEGL